MSRYYFDIHADSLSEWDDDGKEARDADEAVENARLMLATIAEVGRLGRDWHAVIVIRDKVGTQVATLTGVGSAEPRVVRRYA